MNSRVRLRWNFSVSVNFQAVFSSDSVNVAGPLSKTTTKSLSQPILLDLRVKIPKTQEKTQNSRKKLKLWEDFAPPERPSGVIKKAWARGIAISQAQAKQNIPTAVPRGAS